MVHTKDAIDRVTKKIYMIFFFLMLLEEKQNQSCFQLFCCNDLKTFYMKGVVSVQTKKTHHLTMSVIYFYGNWDPPLAINQERNI